jgi:hypothetical protein
MSGALTMQLEQLQERFRGAEVRQMEGDTKLVIVPDVRLSDGWSKTSTTIRFIIPSGYPFAPLDCFWADADLRLANGMQPQNSGCNPIPGHPETLLWFSWHLQGPWNPNRDTLSTWMNVVIDRMRKAV